MKASDFLRNVLGLSADSFSDTPGFRCIRCGDEFERNHNICPSCQAEFVAPIDED